MARRLEALGVLLGGALVLAPSALAAEPGPPDPGPPRRSPPARDAADLALLKEAQEVDDQVLVERARTTRLQAQARAEEYLARLEEAAGKPGAQAAKDRLVAAWTASAESVTQWWPVSPVRVCGNERLLVETAMQDDNPGRRAATLGEARALLTKCVRSARQVVAVVARASAELEGAMRAAEAVVGPVPVARPLPAPGGPPAEGR